MQTHERSEALEVGAESLAAQWFTEYERESVSEDGDTDAFITSIRDLAESTEPGAVAREALAVFLERLRLEDLEVAGDEDSS